MSAFSHNFHTHTARCNHAQGSDREMVLAAMEAGVQVLGFSDGRFSLRLSDPGPTFFL